MLSAVLALVLSLGQVGTPMTAGVATWYDDGPGLYGAVPSWQFGDKPYVVRVCRDEPLTIHACVNVTVRDFCACGDRAGKQTVIDLSPAAFRRLAPLSTGVLPVIVEVLDTVTLPATDTVTYWTWPGDGPR